MLLWLGLGSMAEWRRGARGGGWVRGGEATTDRFLSLLSYVVLLRRGVCEGERSDGYLKALGVHEEGASIFERYAYSHNILSLKVGPQLMCLCRLYSRIVAIH